MTTWNSARTDMPAAPPRIEDLMALHTHLLKLIVQLEPLARRRIDAMNHGTVEWYCAASRLNAVQYEVAEGLGPGLQSAADQVRNLGHTLEFLLNRSGLANVMEGPAVTRGCGWPVTLLAKHLAEVAGVLPGWAVPPALRCDLDMGHVGEHHAVVDVLSATESLWARWVRGPESPVTFVRLPDCHAGITDAEDVCWLPAHHVGGCVWERYR
ncbi:DUF6415 family natural product biosynthesis protein [Streptomyces palmae]|uniref:Uncharacterized protein n=1 Tax=Streptomyces palmae TaxID=1701085 RepID=A0A4Z0HCC3_9ACTN|nr:DUF6415 family natural product biosynthesis protein [Streptomyces palmae]TGB17285.1 hypothetical protein E4099_03850 [Streptomyces palmae]